MKLEEVTLIENPQVLPVVNPPEEPEAPKENPPEESEEVKENPPAMLTNAMGTVKGLFQGVDLISMGVGAVGVVAAIVVPKVVKFNTGWKDLLATAVTAALGGWLIGIKSKPAAVAFVIASGGVFLLKFVKWAMGGFKDQKILLDDLTTPGVQPILDSGMDFDEFSEDGPIFDVADTGLFDVGADPEIQPTAGIDDFY